MKREFLESIELEGGAKLPKEAVDKIMQSNGEDIEATKAKFSDYEEIKTQLSEANTAIEGFKALDVEGVKKAAEEWKIKYEAEVKQSAEKLSDLQFETLLTSAIGTAKGKSAKAIGAMLDVKTLKESKNQAEDIKAALEAVQKEHDYLFDSEETPPPYAGGTGTQQTAAHDAALRAAMGLQTKQ